MDLINTKMSDTGRDEMYVNLHQARNVSLTMVPRYGKDNERPTPLTIPYTSSASGRRRGSDIRDLFLMGPPLTRFLDMASGPGYCMITVYQTPE